MVRPQQGIAPVFFALPPAPPSPPVFSYAVSVTSEKGAETPRVDPAHLTPFTDSIAVPDHCIPSGEEVA